MKSGDRDHGDMDIFRSFEHAFSGFLKFESHVGGRASPQSWPQVPKTRPQRRTARRHRRRPWWPGLENSGAHIGLNRLSRNTRWLGLRPWFCQ